MYLKKSYNKKTGRTQLFIVEAYRDKDKKPKSRVIKTLGYLDVLEKQYSNPVGYFSGLAKKMTAEKNNILSEVQTVLIEEMTEAVKTPPNKISFGCIAIFRVCRLLKIYDIFSSFCELSKAKYSIMSFFNMSIYFRFASPDSNSSFLDDLQMFPKIQASSSDFHRFFDFLTGRHSELFKSLEEKGLPIDTPDEDYYRARNKGLFDDAVILNNKHISESALAIDSIIFSVIRHMGSMLGNRYDTASITESLEKCEYNYRSGDDVYTLNCRDGILDELSEALGTGLNVKYRSFAEISGIFREYF